MPDSVACWIYKSPRKDEMYLYLDQQDNFDAIPAALQQRFGNPVFVMQLQLDKSTKLARASTTSVLQSLAAQGYYLQMPPELKPDIYHGNED